MLIGAGDDVNRAADECLKGLRAATEIVDDDVEALLLEVAEPLGDGQRQIVERGLAADAQRDLPLLGRLRLRGAQDGNHSVKGCKEQSGHSGCPRGGRLAACTL